MSDTEHTYPSTPKPITTTRGILIPHCFPYCRRFHNGDYPTRALFTVNNAVNNVYLYWYLLVFVIVLSPTSCVPGNLIIWVNTFWV